MKKPFISLKSRRERLKFALCITLCAGACALFLVPRDAVSVFAGGANEGVRGLFNMINGWL